MLVTCLGVLMMIVGYLWFFSSHLGYHGEFSFMLYILWFIFYNSCWDLYSCWINNSSYGGVLFSWVELGNGMFMNLAYEVDLLNSVVMMIMSSGSFSVMFLVYVEMWDDKEGSSFMTLLIFFLVYMSMLMSSGNLFVFYLGWEGIGLISLFLISFWSERVSSVKSTFKVFCMNKIGDCLLLMVMCMIIGSLGNVDFNFIAGWGMVTLNKFYYVGHLKFELINILGVMLVLGGGVKSSQFGFHIWLLEAMEAPLGASALMHSSTLVIAGMFLIYKMYSLIELSWIAMSILIIWGSWTALFAAFMACWQLELKVILAYSTVSSMGFLYMMMGFGAMNEMVLYLVMHAFMKIFLFLVVGLVMMYCNGMQDIRWMGSTMGYMSYSFILYFWGSVGLGGLPYWSGYYCKSELWMYVSSHYYIINGCHLCMTLSYMCTYIYLMRVGLLVFSGSSRGHSSMYSMMYMSSIMLMLMWMLLFIMLYCSIMLVELSQHYYRGLYISWVRYLQPLYLEYGMFNWYSWVLLSIIYMVSMLLFFFLIFLWGNSDYSNSRMVWSFMSWFWFILYIMLS